jgi:8-oxo-dGTP diphosphatase
VEQAVVDHARHIVCVTAFVSDERGRLLLVEHPRRGWEPPGGQVEEGEELIDAVRREVEEESGIVVEPGPLVAIYSAVCEPAMLLIAFAARAIGGAPRTSTESVAVEWVEPADVLARVHHPPARMRLADFLEGQPGVRVGAFRRTPFERLR